MRTFVVLLAVLVAMASATLTADFELRSPFFRNGVVVGKISYNYGTGYLRFDYPSQKYFEIQEFNANRGYGGSNTAFRNQWSYRLGQTCGCEVGSVDHVMPILTLADEANTGYITKSNGFIKSTQGQNTVYTLSDKAPEAAAVSGLDGYVTKYVFSPDGLIVSLTFDDERVFTFSNVVANAPIEPSVFTYPTNCKCGRPIDIAFVLDRSGSINAAEWRDQKGFMVNFTSQFEYGPLATNLAIIHFNKIFWVSMTLAEGSSKANVEAGVNSLKCCDSNADDWVKNPDISCCCCGTSISGGMHYGAMELAKSTRPIATKVILTLTDGFHNTQENGDPCGSFAEKYPLGANGTACKGDLHSAVVKSEALVSNVIMYAIGVGDDRTFARDELVVCAQDKEERVLTVSNFDQLYTATLELVAKTCDESSSPCGAGCCGFCTCGQCGAVDKCDDPVDKCLSSAVPAGGSCCVNSPKSCPADTRCATYACDSNVGLPCTGTPVPVPSSTECIKWVCDLDKGVFSTPTPDTCPPGPPPPECATDADCNDGNACTTDKCDTSLQSAKCSWTVVNCDDTLKPDACSEVSCKPSTGCVRTVFPADHCDDQSNCTIDYCDLQKGCQNDNIMTLPDIKDPVTGAIRPDPRKCNDDDPCTTDICHPTLGCVFSPLVCNASAAQVASQTGRPVSSIDPTCLIGFCANGTCGTRELECPVPIATTTIIGASLGTAALVGIIIAAIIAFAACAGGGAYAYSQAAGGDGVHVTANNPIYKGNDNAGTNPLYSA